MLHDLYYLLPVLILFLNGVLFLLFEVFKKEKGATFMGFFSFAGFVISAILLVSFWKTGEFIPFQTEYLKNSLLLNRFSIILSLFVVLVGGISSVTSLPFLSTYEIEKGEFFSMINFATGGMMVMLFSVDLIALFIGLEIMSLSVYILVAFRRSDSYFSVEAAIKYFVMGAVASAFFLMSIAFLYGLTVSTNLIQIGNTILKGGIKFNDFPIYIVLVFLIFSLGFKISSVPFHFWTPDVYQGAPSPVTGFMATGVKVASFGILLKIIYFIFHDPKFFRSDVNFLSLLYIISIASMFGGNLLAIVQKNVKRMLAYSSIAHAGYMLIAVITAFKTDGFVYFSPSVVFYLFTYTLSNLIAFGAFSLFDKKVDDDLTYDRLNGLGKKHPFVSMLLAMAMLSLAGIPPFGGFFAKFYVFRDALKLNSAVYLPIVIIAVLNSLISVYYYLKVIVHLFFKNSETASVGFKKVTSAFVAIGACAFLLLHTGIFPTRYIKASIRATKTFYSQQVKTSSTDSHWSLNEKYGTKTD